MKLWNVSNKEISQLYNNQGYVIGANEVKELSDDVAVFLLSKREIKGRGLVQLKDTDDKAIRYKEARLNLYSWAKEKYQDYERHCEERQAQSLVALKPHKEISEYKDTIDKYEDWEAKGFPLDGLDLEVKDNRKVVYVCPVCNKEFDLKVAYFGHMRSHQKDENVISGAVSKVDK